MTRDATFVQRLGDVGKQFVQDFSRDLRSNVLAQSESGRRQLQREEEQRQLAQLGSALSGISSGQQATPQQLQQLVAAGPAGAQFATNLLASQISQRPTAIEQERLQLQKRKQGLDERKFQEEVRKAQRAEEQGFVDSDLFDTSRKLRQEFTGLNKDFVKIRDAFGRIQASTEEPSAAGDLALIFNFMKMLDPGSVVREGEFATAQNTASVPESIRARYNKLLEGERLTPKIRQDFFGQSERLFNKTAAQHNKSINQFTKLAKRFGIPEDLVVIDIGLSEQEAQAEDVGIMPAQDERVRALEILRQRRRID